MKTVEELIVRVRRETRNATVGNYKAGSSISDAEFVDQLDDAQQACVELVTANFATYFEKTKVYTIDTSVANYEQLAIPSDLLLGSRIVSVEYSHDGTAANYYCLVPLDIRERYSGTSYRGVISGYSLSGQYIILSGIPSANGAKVRLVYEASPLRLDVAKAICTTFSRSSTTVTVAYTVASAHDDVLTWDVGDTVNAINRANGDIIVKDGLITAIDTGAGTMTISLASAEYTAATVDAVTASNVRLIEGGRTNRSELSDYAEKFLVAYAALEILGRDGSMLANKMSNRLTAIGNSLTRSYMVGTKDFTAVQGD